MKRKPKSLPKLKKEALDLFSELVKIKDFNEDKLYCFTCDKPLKLHSSDTHLGHFLSRGAYPGLTFHKDNSRPQCYRCNCHLHGATIEFRTRLILQIGRAAVEKLEAQRFEQVKWSRSELLEMIAFYKNEINNLK
jgi:hypothetical protein